MPDFLFQWIKLLIYYLNLLFGNIAIVRVLKRFLEKIEQPNLFYYFLPTIIIFAFALVVVLVVLTRLFAKPKKEAVWVKKR
ncbi:MAG: hypothetical protein N2445_01240 [Acidobacteria bacterium]|nr:hypothetical protein [Acidobacteriota bacterium]